MDHLDQISLSESDVAPYRTACRENVAFVIEMLEAMRAEAEIVGDHSSSQFWAGVAGAITAFATRRSMNSSRGTFPR